jgi:hypothetical protein
MRPTDLSDKRLPDGTKHTGPVDSVQLSPHLGLSTSSPNLSHDYCQLCRGPKRVKLG